MKPTAAVDRHTLVDMARALNRPPIALSGLQRKFDLPVFKGAEYSDAYLALLRTLVHLRILGVSEQALRDLWELEKKLLHLLNFDSTGSPTWFLDSCGTTRRLDHRLLLTNFDMGVSLASRSVQVGLQFVEKRPELFAGTEMGEDAVRVLRQYLESLDRMACTVQAERRLVAAAARWRRLQ